MFKTLTVLTLMSSLSGCASLIATATGPEPLGRANGERTLSMRIEDSSIANTVEVNIYKANPKFRDANVNVVVFYGSVLLAGQVPSEAMKAQAEKVARDIAEVKQVHNELVVTEASYYLERSSDGIISTQIRSSLTFEKDYPSSRTKVFTVTGTVYLLGRLTTAEADHAVTIIKQVTGVKKIVKLVDYLPAPASDAAPGTGNPQNPV